VPAAMSPPLRLHWYRVHRVDDHHGGDAYPDELLGYRRAEGAAADQTHGESVYAVAEDSECVTLTRVDQPLLLDGTSLRAR
jgi:hypothetical protein